MFRGKMLIALFVATVIASGRASAEISQAEWEAVKRELAEVKRTNADLQSKVAPVKSKVDKALDTKYGPNANVSTKNGKLTISGLVQVWYYSIENDSEGLFQDITVNDITDTNETQDNDSFRIRRTELKFTMDIHENITAVVMFDPSREATSFPAFNSNPGTSKRGLGSATAVQTGAGAVPRLLQDAFINYHGVVPHHDFTIGQYKPFYGEEGIRR